MEEAIHGRQRRNEFKEYWERCDLDGTLNHTDCEILLSMHRRFPYHYLEWKYGKDTWKHIESTCRIMVADHEQRMRDLVNEPWTPVFTNFDDL